MKNKPHNKNVVVIVEGKSDLKAFEVVLPELYECVDESYQVFFTRVLEDDILKSGDITSKRGITPNNIEGLINKLLVGPVLARQKIYARDIDEIIHLVDMDGAYIPDDCITECSPEFNGGKYFYGEDGISAPSVDDVRERNQRKRDNMDALIGISEDVFHVHQNPENPRSKQSKVPYFVYYFSSNLDHFLQGDPNLLDPRKKIAGGEKFALEYGKDPEAALNRLLNDPDAAGDLTYAESWEFIRQRNLNSIHRHTNIDLLIKRLQSMVDSQ